MPERPPKKHKTEERIQRGKQASDEEESVPDWGDDTSRCSADAADTKEHPEPANTADATTEEGAPASWPWSDEGRSSDRGDSTGILGERPSEPATAPRRQSEAGGSDNPYNVPSSWCKHTWQDDEQNRDYHVKAQSEPVSRGTFCPRASFLQECTVSRKSSIFHLQHKGGRRLFVLLPDSLHAVCLLNVPLCHSQSVLRGFEFGGEGEAKFNFDPAVYIPCQLLRNSEGDCMFFFLLPQAGEGLKGETCYAHWLLVLIVLYEPCQPCHVLSSRAFFGQKSKKGVRHPVDCGCALARRAQGGLPCVLFPERERERERESIAILAQAASAQAPSPTD